jgi:hypothetical protein
VLPWSWVHHVGDCLRHQHRAHQRPPASGFAGRDIGRDAISWYAHSVSASTHCTSSNQQGVVPSHSLRSRAETPVASYAALP